MIRLLVGDRDAVDFAEPVEMTEAQRSRFVAFLGELFADDVVEAEEVTEFRSDRLGERRFPRQWSSTELRYLLETRDLEEVARLLGRTHMSVVIKRGSFVGEFLQWLRRSGHELTDENLVELIERFLEERRRAQAERRQRKHKSKNWRRELEEKKRQLEQMIAMREIMVRTGQAEEDIIEEVRLDLEKVEALLEEAQEADDP